MDHSQQVYHKCCDAELTIKLSKCHFFAKEILYFGHVLSTTAIKPLLSKTAAVRLMNPSKKAKQVRAFLGLVGYYHKFIRNFAHIAKLTTITHHDAKSAWTSSHLTAFNTLKIADSPKQYIVYMDASGDACGAQLSQEHDGQELPVTFLSHIHRHPTEMEHYRTGSLCHLLCCNKVELLSTEIWHCSPQWPQAFTEICKW